MSVHVGLTWNRLCSEGKVRVVVKGCNQHQGVHYNYTFASSTAVPRNGLMASHLCNKQLDLEYLTLTYNMRSLGRAERVCVDADV